MQQAGSRLPRMACAPTQAVDRSVVDEGVPGLELSKKKGKEEKKEEKKDDGKPKKQVRGRQCCC